MSARPPAPTTSYTDNAEFWLNIIRQDLDPYRRELTNDAVLAAVDARPGLRILDVGCGEGYLSRLMADRGAHVVGVDSCSALVEAAVETAGHAKHGCRYLTATANTLPLGSASVDVVVCNHVINDLVELDEPFREFRRVLRRHGQLVVLMLHPCFYQPHSERRSNGAPISVADYFRGRVVEQTFSVAGLTSPAPVTVRIRPLEAITNALAGAGFAIASLTEPHPSPEQIASNSWWQDNFTKPMFILITAVPL